MFSMYVNMHTWIFVKRSFKNTKIPNLFGFPKVSGIFFNDFFEDVGLPYKWPTFFTHSLGPLKQWPISWFYAHF